MKRTITFILMILFLAAIPSYSWAKSKELKVLQLNIWLEGTKVPNGLESIADNIIHSDADVVTLSEIANYSGSDFISRLLACLKEKGLKFYGKYGNNTGIISKYPVKEQSVVYREKNSNSPIVTKVTCIVYGLIFKIYSIHLDYTHYSCYLPRGYNGNDWKKMKKPEESVSKILQNNLDSERDEAIEAFVKDSKQELKLNHIVIMGGDFNEPSDLDWGEDTKNRYDHNGLIIPWNTSITLRKAGFIDAYRNIYTHALENPGFTFPSDNPEVSTNILTWAPEVDERERIDFVYFYPNRHLSVKEACILGPTKSIVRNKRVEEESKDQFIEPNGSWPTDHKGILVSFRIKNL